VLVVLFNLDDVRFAAQDSTDILRPEWIEPHGYLRRVPSNEEQGWLFMRGNGSVIGLSEYVYHTRDEELPNDRLHEWEPIVEITAMVRFSILQGLGAQVGQRTATEARVSIGSFQSIQRGRTTPSSTIMGITTKLTRFMYRCCSKDKR
jgi:hypothetical protein